MNTQRSACSVGALGTVLHGDRIESEDARRTIREPH